MLSKLSTKPKVRAGLLKQAVSWACGMCRTNVSDAAQQANQRPAVIATIMPANMFSTSV